MDANICAHVVLSLRNNAADDAAKINQHESGIHCN
jgi:hypothetical protein